MSRELKNPRIKEALLQETVNGKVRCLTCERYCQIAEGEFGFCQTRKNIEGKLYTLVYGDISSWSVNPMEKKPLFHFWPASSALTVGTWSCNFAKDAYVPATSAKALEKAREIGREEGLNYVYVGNLPGHPFENTYCPNCEELLIKRYGFSVSRYNIRDRKCPECGKGIPIIGH